MTSASVRHTCLLPTFALVLYAQWNTGLATDDFVFLRKALSGSLESNLWPDVYISVPLLHYTHALAYFAFGEHFWAYSLLKAAYLFFAICAAQRFFALFFSPLRAWFGALLLLLSPLHDAATLWFAAQYLILSLGFYLLAYVKAHEERDGAALLLALCGSFSSYGSPPLAAGLALMFLLQKRWRAAALMLAPNLVYSAYYSYTSAILKVGTTRLPGEFSIWSLVKSYAAQLASFLDAGAGPSAWLKYALSLSSLSWMSLMAALAAAAGLWRLSQRHSLPATNPVPGRLLLAGCGAIALGAFGIFALTSSYPQVAFNLGDRVMIYGNLFLVSLALHFARPAALTTLTAITVTAFLGISDHWTGWNGVVRESAAHIRALDVPIKPGETLFVRGLQYSRLGPMTHIDHFTANYVVRDVFAVARHGQAKIPTASFNPRLRLESDHLVDIKYGDRTAMGESILLYDAERNTLTRVPRGEIKNQLAALPRELRHWTQLIGPGIVRDTILVLMPRLKYAYPD
jgi:hypothetical protein